LIFCCKVEECYIRTESGIISSTCGQKGTAGVPLTNIKIVPEASKDKIGEIWVSGPNITGVSFQFLFFLIFQNLGTGQTPGDAQNRFENGWFNTLQIGSWNSDGTLNVTPLL
jgi:hypothetical protein